MAREGQGEHEKEAASDDAKKAHAIVASLSAGEASSEEVFAAFAELDALPETAVRDALGRWIGPAPDLASLDDATRRAHGLPSRPIRLRTLEVVRDADVLDLGTIAEEQLRIAGKSWDGLDLAPEERLDGEVEGSFAGTLERRVLADAEHPDVPLFDVLLYAGDAGIVFRAGTIQVVAMIAYGRVEMRDARVRTAIEAALAEAPPPAPVEPEEEVAVAPPKKKKKAPPSTPSTPRTPKAKAAPAKKTAKKKTAAAPAKKTTTKKKAATATTKKKKKASTKKKAAKKTSDG